mgnify:CR=1 FL=1
MKTSTKIPEICSGLCCASNHNDRNGHRLRFMGWSTFFIFVLAVPPLFADPIIGKASWYSSNDCCGKKTNNLKGCPTASGESLYDLERRNELWIASNDLALGTRVRVSNIDSGRSFVGVVKDRGGFKKYGRIADLCKAGFQRLAPASQGIITVKMEVVL